jgi:hypothetical protein
VKLAPRLVCYAVLALSVFGQAAELRAQRPADEEGRNRFRTIDIFIEGGEPEAFRQPPVYDPKAMQHDRVIIASFSTAATSTLPMGKTRVATIHIQISGDQVPQFEIKLQTAGDSRGHKISAQVTFEERKMP